MKAAVLFREIAEMAQSIDKPIVLTWKPHFDRTTGIDWVVSIDYDQTHISDISEIMPAIYNAIEKKAESAISTDEKVQGDASKRIIEQRDVLSFMEARRATNPVPAD